MIIMFLVHLVLFFRLEIGRVLFGFGWERFTGDSPREPFKWTLGGAHAVQWWARLF